MAEEKVQCHVGSAIITLLDFNRLCWLMTVEYQ